MFLNHRHSLVYVGVTSRALSNWKMDGPFLDDDGWNDDDDWNCARPATSAGGGNAEN
jgi:hypothetical protein